MSWEIFSERKFAARFVRDCCTHIYGKQLSADCWTQWRRWANVPARSRELTFEHFCVLAAIAYIRGKQLPYNHHREQLRRSEIEVIAYSVELQAQLELYIRAADLKKCIGKDAPAALRQRGITITMAELYELIPGFSNTKVCKIDDLVKKLKQCGKSNA